MGKRVITADDVEKAVAAGKKNLACNQGDCIVTPGAWDRIEALGIGFAGDAGSSQGPCEVPGAGCKTETGEPSGNRELIDKVCATLQDRVPGMDAARLSAVVTSVVESRLSETPGGSACTAASAAREIGGVSLIDGDGLLDACQGPDMPGKVRISDAVRCHQDSHLTATYMTWENGAFARVAESPEINIVVEGEVAVKSDDGELKAKAGDILYLTKGARVEYDTPTMVKLACIGS